MFVNRPVGASYPNLLGQTRSMTYVQPQAPTYPQPAATSVYVQSTAGPSVTANLKALGQTLWAAAKDLFAKFKQGLSEIK